MVWSSESSAVPLSPTESLAWHEMMETQTCRKMKTRHADCQSSAGVLHSVQNSSQEKVQTDVARDVIPSLPGVFQETLSVVRALVHVYSP